MNFNRFFAPLYFSLGLLAFGCAKTGPAGPAGSTGPQGLQGSQGVQGPQGNANVFTDTFTMANKDWLMSSIYWYATTSGISIGYTSRFHDQSFSKLTSDILASGQIMVYFTPSLQVDSTMWVPLPYSFISTTTQFYYNYAYETMVGKVRLHYYYTAATAGVTLPQLKADSLATHKFKIVVVSGTISTAMRRDSVNSGDYRQVMKYLNLQ